MKGTRYALGRNETPVDVADLLVGLCIDRPGDRVLDPGCGSGVILARAAAWLDWLSAAPLVSTNSGLVGLDLDDERAAEAQKSIPHADIIHDNFLALSVDELGQFDAIVSNPPFAPVQDIGSFEEISPRQMSLFSSMEDETAEDKIPLVSLKLATTLSVRSGLHTYFLLHSTEFLREGGRLAFIVPNGWLDVAYGAELKQYLLDHYRVMAIIESAVERWFDEAWINTCILLLEKCTNLRRRQGNLVHLARLKKPLSQLLPYSISSPHRFVILERLIRRMLPGQSTVNDDADIHVKEQRTMHAESKWGMSLRSPMVFRHHRDHLNLAPLNTWAQIHRGYTTGANEFFYLSDDAIEKWGIEGRFRKPLLKSLRGLDHLQLSAADVKSEMLSIAPDANLKGTAVAHYVAWAEQQGFHLRRTCANRQPWYSLPLQSAAPFVMPKGIWQRHFVPVLTDDLAVDQQLYQISISPYLPHMAVAALLNSSWFALQVELRGRVSFGKGLLWLAAYELSEVQIPDPRQLSSEQAARLTEAFAQLTKRRLVNTLDDLNKADRRELDEAVFDILGFNAQEREDTLDSLKQRLSSRKRRAS